MLELLMALGLLVASVVSGGGVVLGAMAVAFGRPRRGFMVLCLALVSAMSTLSGWQGLLAG